MWEEQEAERILKEKEQRELDVLSKKRLDRYCVLPINAKLLFDENSLKIIFFNRFLNGIRMTHKFLTTKVRLWFIFFGFFL